jgi:heme exporter protein D
MSEFFAMGGYGVYVWTSYVVTALCMLWEVLALWRRRTAARAEHRVMLRGGADETAA